MCSKQEHDYKVLIKHWKTDVFGGIIVFKLQGFENCLISLFFPS